MTMTAVAGEGFPRRGGKNPAEIVRNSGLPQELCDLVLAVTGKTRLWAGERNDIARELVNHFAEGLAEGEMPGALAAAFGEPVQVARLITRAKKRNRPWAWRAMRRTLQGMGCFILALVLTYAALFIRFQFGHTVISHNYLAELNAPALAVPRDQRAWPIYREAFLSLPNLQDEHWGALANQWPECKPSDAAWPLMLEYLAQSKGAIESIRRAAAMEHAAFLISSKTSLDGRDPGGIAEPARDENAMLIGVLIPNLSAYRQMARLLKADLLVARTANDPARAAADLHAMLGLARHSTEGRWLISQLVGLAILDLADGTMGQVLSEQPAFLPDADLRTLAHELGAFRPSPTGPREQVDLSAERFCVDDILQRAFTDDGRGDGHYAGITSIYNQWGMVRPKGLEAIAPVASAAIAGRADTKRVYDEVMDRYVSQFQTPLYARDFSAIDRRVEELSSSVVGVRYAMVTVMLPSLSQAQRGVDAALQTRDAIVTAIAIELHTRKTGHAPATLHDLVPEFLPAAPIDHWSGEPLKYLPEGNAKFPGRPVLYSIGADRVDDGGIIGAPWDPSGARNKAAYPAQSGDVPTRDWVLWPPVESVGNPPPVRDQPTRKRSGLSKLARGILPWTALYGAD